ncbi:DUF7119 family protein [Halocatena pleomorpha]|uniref:DUF7119 domain-containing protein n=1 Tax=Halocatena pleomorpha TaxID=1785090 RepID=A0A3P3RG55_9EURY|nr:hypothetical protein [Halocatena pleomorpha]RRJ32507.1 hypothetical protein EIK79_04595 [Halocatena pleomorpha]
MSGNPPPTDRESPVGQPVIRGNPELAGERAPQAVQFDPSDPESLSAAAETVRAFADNTAGAEDNIYMLRGAAACAALVRGEGSYKSAAERAGDGVTVSFIRKWARVHDLPRPVRKYVATGRIAPTAAKHIARVHGETRYQLAWTVLDHDLTVREVRAIASDVNDGRSLGAALEKRGLELGRLTLSLPSQTYLELRRVAAINDTDPETIVTDALEQTTNQRR